MPPRNETARRKKARKKAKSRDPATQRGLLNDLEALMWHIVLLPDGELGTQVGRGEQGKAYQEVRRRASDLQARLGRLHQSTHTRHWQAVQGIVTTIVESLDAETPTRDAVLAAIRGGGDGGSKSLASSSPSSVIHLLRACCWSGGGGGDSRAGANPGGTRDIVVSGGGGHGGDDSAGPGIPNFVKAGVMNCADSTAAHVLHAMCIHAVADGKSAFTAEEGDAAESREDKTARLLVRVVTHFLDREHNGHRLAGAKQAMSLVVQARQGSQLTKDSGADALELITIALDAVRQESHPMSLPIALTLRRLPDKTCNIHEDVLDALDTDECARLSDEGWKDAHDMSFVLGYQAASSQLTYAVPVFIKPRVEGGLGFRLVAVAVHVHGDSDDGGHYVAVRNASGVPRDGHVPYIKVDDGMVQLLRGDSSGDSPIQLDCGERPVCVCYTAVLPHATFSAAPASAPAADHEACAGRCNEQRPQKRRREGDAAPSLAPADDVQPRATLDAQGPAGDSSALRPLRRRRQGARTKM